MQALYSSASGYFRMQTMRVPARGIQQLKSYRKYYQSWLEAQRLQTRSYRLNFALIAPCVRACLLAANSTMNENAELLPNRTRLKCDKFISLKEGISLGAVFIRLYLSFYHFLRVVTDVVVWSCEGTAQEEALAFMDSFGMKFIARASKRVQPDPLTRVLLYIPRLQFLRKLLFSLTCLFTHLSWC